MVMSPLVSPRKLGTGLVFRLVQLPFCRPTGPHCRCPCVLKSDEALVSYEHLGFQTILCALEYRAVVRQCAPILQILQIADPNKVPPPSCKSQIPWSASLQSPGVAPEATSRANRRMASLRVAAPPPAPPCSWKCRPPGGQALTLRVRWETQETLQ